MSNPISCKYAFKCNSVAILMSTAVSFAFFLELTSKEAAKLMHLFKMVTFSAYVFINENAMNIRKAQM